MRQEWQLWRSSRESRLPRELLCHSSELISALCVAQGTATKALVAEAQLHVPVPLGKAPSARLGCESVSLQLPQRVEAAPSAAGLLASGAPLTHRHLSAVLPGEAPTAMSLCRSQTLQHVGGLGVRHCSHGRTLRLGQGTPGSSCLQRRTAARTALRTALGFVLERFCLLLLLASTFPGGV